MADQYFILFFVIFHSSLSILTGYWLFHRFRDDKKRAGVWKWMAIIISFFIPVYGLIGIVSLFVILKRKSGISNAMTHLRFNEHLQKNSINQTEVEESDNSLNWKEVKEIQPIIDTLLDMDVELQKGAIDSLTAKHDPESIKILLDSLEYTVPEVRYFTVEALSKISKHYSDRILHIQQKIAGNPEMKSIVVKLADCYYEYAISNVEDKALSKYYLEQAAAQYSITLKDDNSNINVLTKYGDTLKRLERYREAIEIFRNVIEHDNKNISVLLNLIDVYFTLGNMDEVKKVARQLKESSVQVPEFINKAISVWV